MELPSEKERGEIIKEGKKAHEAIEHILGLDNMRVTEEFIDLAKSRFSFLFRTSLRNYKTDAEILSEISRVLNYFETILLPNFNDSLDTNSLSPQVQILFFRSISDAYSEFNKRHNLPM